MQLWAQLYHKAVPHQRMVIEGKESFMQTKYLCVLWNRFNPSGKLLNWPFQGGTSFVDLLCFSVLFCYAFVCVCLCVPCSHLLEKGWPLGSRLWCLTLSLSLSHWYPVSGVVLDCIDSWSLHPYLLLWCRVLVFLVVWFSDLTKYSGMLETC